MDARLWTGAACDGESWVALTCYFGPDGFRIQPASTAGDGGQGGAQGARRGWDSHRRGDLYAGGAAAWFGTQSARAAGRSFGARRDGCFSQCGTTAVVSRADHGNDAGSVLVLQRAGAAVWVSHADCWREPDVSGRARLVAVAWG